MLITVILKNLKGTKKIILNDINKSCIVNDKKKNINVDMFASKLLRIVSSWEEVYENPYIIDGLSYEVKIEKDGKTYNYYGKNDFPKNFHQFTELLSEVLDG